MCHFQSTSIHPVSLSLNVHQYELLICDKDCHPISTAIANISEVFFLICLHSSPNLYYVNLNNERHNQMIFHSENSSVSRVSDFYASGHGFEPYVRCGSNAVNSLSSREAASH